jgi:hypothetical protein
MAAQLRTVVADDDPILLFPEACEIARILPGTMRELRRKRQGPPFSKSGRHLRIRKSALLDWLVNHYDRPA